MSNQKLRAYIIEDFSLIAEAWASILKSMDFGSVQIFNSAEDTINALNNNEQLPDIFLIDINILGHKNGIGLAKDIIEQYSTAKIITLTMQVESYFVNAAFNAGVKGFVTKNSSIEELKKAILIVLAGKEYRCNEINKNL